MVTGPRASQPPAVTGQPACLPGSQGAQLVPTCSQLPCPMLCPLTEHTYRGTSHFRGLLRCQRSPIFSARCPLAVAQVLFLWFLSVAPWTPQSQPPLLPAQQPPATRPTWLTRPPSLAHLHPLTFWSPRLALAPHSDTTQTPGLLRGHLGSKET